MRRFAKAALVLIAAGLFGTAWWLAAAGYFRFIGTNLFENIAASSISTYLAIFFFLVGFRYVLLICFSFMEHIDNQLVEKDDGQQVDNALLPFVSIVIPAFNEALVIRQALNSLINLDYPNYEVIVVDDGSTDDTFAHAKEVASIEQRVKIRVFTKANGGKADALNVGLAHARGQFVLNMDGDTLLSRNALRDCIRHFNDPNIGAVAGNIKIFNRENILTRMQALEYIEGLAMARKAQSYARICNIIPGPLGMFRKEALRQVGGYDHDTFAEDCDVTLKMLLQGWHVAYEAKAIAWVETPSRMLDLIKQRYRWSRGILQAIRKHRSTLWSPKKGGINCLILWYMIFENFVWPITNVLSNLVFVYIGLKYGVILFLLYWWVQLTLLDIAAAIYCVVLENEDISLVAYAPFFRIFYILMIDVSKVFANLEELLGTRMTWGKLEREGKL